MITWPDACFGIFAVLCMTALVLLWIMSME